MMRRVLHLVLRLTGYRRTFAAFAGAGLLGLAGCASPGLPRSPSLHLPERLTDVTAERRGDTVVLRFVTPTQSTDGMPLTAPVSARLCRVEGESGAGAGQCLPTESFPGMVAVAGPVVWVDRLPPRLAMGPPRLLTYRISLFNAAGRTAGLSDPVVTAAGDAPRAVEELRAVGQRTGIVLRWKPEAVVSGEVVLERKRVAGPSAAAPTEREAQAVRKTRAVAVGGAASSAEKDVVLLRAPGTVGGKDAGGVVDSGAEMDVAYVYTAMRSLKVTLGGTAVELRSENSAPVAVTLVDVFPPAMPVGLQAAEFPVEGSSSVAVDLVWQPNVEGDFAGYNVFRQTVGADGSAAGAAVKLNDSLLPLPSFHDATAFHGARYRYTVTAVDAKKNASPPSAPVDVSTAP